MSIQAPTQCEEKVQQQTKSEETPQRAQAAEVQDDGAIAPGTLRIATSSGQPRLDASALKTVEASAPFAAAPPSSIAIAVVYGKLTTDAKKKW